MPTRILRDWTDSLRVAELSADAERFFIRLIMKADDFGRFHGDERLLKAALFPLLPDIRLTAVRHWCDECVTADLLALYQDGRGRKFLEINGFNQRTRAKSSKFPPPDGHMPVECPSSALGDGDGDGDVPECPIPVASDETRSFLDSLWKLSPRTSRPRTSRKDVTAAWKSIPAKDRPTHDEALAAYLAWTKCEAWTKENGQYVCGLHLWIRKRQWENVPEGATPGATPGAGCRKLSNEKGF